MIQSPYNFRLLQGKGGASGLPYTLMTGSTNCSGQVINGLPWH